MIESNIRLIASRGLPHDRSLKRGKPALLHVAIQRGEKETAPVAEGSVQATTIDVRSFQQVGNGSGFIASLLEDPHRTIRNLVFIKALYAHHI